MTSILAALSRASVGLLGMAVGLGLLGPISVSLAEEFAPDLRTDESAVGERLRYEESSLIGGFIRCVDGYCEQGNSVAVRSDQPSKVGTDTAGELRKSDSLMARQVDDSAISAAQTRRAVEMGGLLTRMGGGDEHVVLTLWLWEEDISLDELRGARGDEAALATAVAIRKSLYRDSQDQVGNHVEARGGVVLARRWLMNAVVVSVPAREVSALAAHPLVNTVFESGRFVESEGGDGFDRQYSSSWSAYLYFETGSHGGITPPGPIEVAIIEKSRLNTVHVAWNDASGNSRLIETDDCGYWECNGSSSTTSNTHSTRVTSVIVASLVDGQDPNFPGFRSFYQRQRSGLAIDADFQYYNAHGDTDYLCTAIESAVEDGNDVVNLSIGITPSSTGADCHSNSCNELYNPSGIRQALYAAENAGLVAVASAGNAGNNPGSSCASCSTEQPAMHPDVISVSGIEDTAFTVFGQANRHPSASFGWYTSAIRGGSTSSVVPSVDLTAMNVVRHVVTSGTNNYDSQTRIGTSYAAPFVTSLAVLFRQWMVDHGFASLSQHAWAVQVNLLLMGDARESPAGSALARFYVDSEFGFGFPRYNRPGSDMGSTTGWATQEIHVNQGETVSWPVGTVGPESTAISGWKWAVAADTSATQPADYNVRVVDTCPPGGGEVVVQGALPQGTRYRVVLDDAPNQIHGRCLEMRLTANAVSSGGETFWTADYFWSNADSLHLNK